MKFRIVISQWSFKGNTGKLLKLGPNDRSRFFFSFGVWFVSHIVRVSRPITDRNNENQSSAGLLFTLSYELLYIKISIKPRKLIQTEKTWNLLKTIFNVRNILLRLRTEFRERNSWNFAIFSGCVLFLREFFPGL